MVDINLSISQRLIEKLSEYPEWMNDAACADETIEEWPLIRDDNFAENVCSKCPVIEQCKQYTEDAIDSGAEINLGIFHGEWYGG